MAAFSSSVFDLTGRTALVTGARRGIGLAVASALAEAGADIVAVSRTADHFQLEAAVTAAGRSFTSYACDLADRTATERLGAELTRDGATPIDVFFGNAGAFRRRPALEQSDDDWDEVLEVNLSAQFLLARALGEGMLDRAHGRILFTASMLSFQGGLNVVGYAAAKSGLSGLTKALSNEWSGRGVTVNAIAPGYIDTAVTEGLIADPVRSRQILERIPIGRWGRPADIAGAAVFLASDAAAYVTGTVLPVDGGWLGR
ncbi:SDR family oxidoreductase [Herbiconiux moechotypicola]|uniref:SDR family oxidoreductase n=2 Tax=Herbiconiux moechotypicola TaxID=637393 RepID=A0ABP5Q7J3_9MICO|nr:SDR family oxidoreductase [Herbiconiux moechotypicola]